MSVTVGTTGASATPATDLYNLLATAMTTDGNWTEQSDSPVAAATAGTTADVRVWRCTGGVASFYLMIEVDDANLRLRFRLSEAYNTTTHKPNQPAGGGTSSTASVTPTANGTVTDTEQTINTATTVAYVEIKVLGSAYNYLYEARNNLLTVATKVSSTPYYAIAGCFTSLVQAISDTAPIVLLGHATSPGLNSSAETNTAANAGRFTRLPGFGASALTGAFCVNAIPLFALNSALPNATLNTWGTVAGASTNPWFANPIVAPAILNGAGNNGPGDRRGLRGFLPNFVSGFYTTEPLITDTFTVGGVTYYALGASRLMNTTATTSTFLAIRG
jgi:hypothetical protein